MFPNYLLYTLCFNLNILAYRICFRRNLDLFVRNLDELSYSSNYSLDEIAFRHFRQNGVYTKWFWTKCHGSIPDIHNSVIEKVCLDLKL